MHADLSTVGLVLETGNRCNDVQVALVARSSFLTGRAFKLADINDVLQQRGRLAARLIRFRVVSLFQGAQCGQQFCV